MLSLVLPCVLLTACSSPTDGDLASRSEGPLVVYTTFFPTSYFAKRIGGEQVEVVCPVPADGDPIFWQPDSQTIRKYQQADLIVINGADFEKWVQNASLPASKLVNTAEDFQDQWIRYQEATTHSHGPEGEHTHEGIDGHTWLDPINATQQAQAIAEAMIEADQQHKKEFQENLKQLRSELNQLDQQLKSLTKQLGDRPLLASHPAYNYLAARYGWDVVNFDLDPETMPTAETLQTIRAMLEKRPAQLILWESEPTTAIANRLSQEFGLTSVIYSPAELVEGNTDYLEIQRQNIDRLRQALQSIQPADSSD